MSSVGSSGKNTRQVQKDFNESMEEQAGLFYKESGLLGEYQGLPCLPVNCSLVPTGSGLLAWRVQTNGLVSVLITC